MADPPDDNSSELVRSDREGIASCTLWCRSCGRDFVVMGMLRQHRHSTPAVEPVACPYCHHLRRVMLARHLDGPVTEVLTLEEWQSRGGGG